MGGAGFCFKPALILPGLPPPNPSVLRSSLAGGGGGGGRSQTQEAPAMAADEIRAVEEGKPKASPGLCSTTLSFSARKCCS